MHRRFYSFLSLLPVLLMLPCSILHSQGWTFTETIQQSGQCIPYPPYPSVTYATKSACEASRQSELANNGEDWSIYGDGSCVTIITCTPCTGSDMGSGSGSSGSYNPGDVSFTGLLSGEAFFSAHPSKEVEDWIYDYMQRMNSLGLNLEGVTLITPGDVPLTGNNEFDRFYAEQMMTFKKPEKGGVVYLNDGSGVVDPADLKKPAAAATVAAGTAALAGTVSIPASENTWYHMEPMSNGGIPPLPVSAAGGEVRNEHPRIELVREASVTMAGWLPDGAAYPGILAVNIWAENAKAIQDIREGNAPPGTLEILEKASVNTLTDWTNQAVSDVQGAAFEKVLKVADQGTGISKLISGVSDVNDKWQDLGGDVAGGEGPGIFGQITQAAIWSAQPTGGPGN